MALAKKEDRLVREKHLNIARFGLIEEGASEADARYRHSIGRSSNNYGGVVLDLKSYL